MTCTRQPYCSCCVKAEEWEAEARGHVRSMKQFAETLGIDTTKEGDEPGQLQILHAIEDERVRAGRYLDALVFLALNEGALTLGEAPITVESRRGGWHVYVEGRQMAGPLGVRAAILAALDTKARRGVLPDTKPCGCPRTTAESDGHCTNCGAATS